MALSEEQLNNKLNDQKYIKQQYEKERTQYVNALGKSRKLKEQLDKINSELQETADDIKANFKFKTTTGDNGKVNTLKEQVIQIIKKLNEEIIPNINSCISELSRKINNINDQINRMKNEINIIK